MDGHHDSVQVDQIVLAQLFRLLLMVVASRHAQGERGERLLSHRGPAGCDRFVRDHSWVEQSCDLAFRDLELSAPATVSRSTRPPSVAPREGGGLPGSPLGGRATRRGDRRSLAVLRLPLSNRRDPLGVRHLQ